MGQDSYDLGATINTSLTSTVGGTSNSSVVAAVPNIKRTNYFLDASLNLPLFKIVGEVGQVTGGTVNTYNSIGTERADKSLTYGSVGLRFAL